MSAWKSLLSSVPVTEPNKVVALYDPLAPPPGLIPTWREIVEIRRRRDHKLIAKAGEEQRLAIEIEATRQAIARAEREIAEDDRLLAEALELWRVMTAPIEGGGDESTDKDQHQ